MGDYFPDEVQNFEVYTEKKREDGSGPLRIGTFLQTNEDIYALLFASHFRTDVIDMNRWINKHKQDLLDLAGEQYYEQNKLVNAPKEIKEVLESKDAWLNKRVETKWYENKKALKKVTWFSY